MHIAQNESTLDRFIRIAVGGLCIIIATYMELPAIMVTTLLIIGIILLLTALSGFCLLYKILKIKTCQ